MKLNNFSALTLFFLIFVVSGKIAIAQNYPAKLLNEIPEAAQVLDSPGVRERGSILKKLVVAEPMNCTNEQNLPFNLTREKITNSSSVRFWNLIYPRSITKKMLKFGENCNFSLSDLKCFGSLKITLNIWIIPKETFRPK